MAKKPALPAVTIRPGQRWQRNSNGTIVEVVEERIDTHYFEATDDWKVRKEQTGRTGWIFGFNLKRLYTLLDEPAEES